MTIYATIILTAGVAAVLFMIYFALRARDVVTSWSRQLTDMTRSIEQLHSELEELRQPEPQPIGEDGHQVMSGNDAEDQEDVNLHEEVIIPILKSLGCNPSRDEENNIFFQYQGLRMYNRGPEKSAMQRIIVPGILDVEADDANLPRFIEAANQAQSDWGCKVYWAKQWDEDEQKNVFRFHLMVDYIIVPQMPKISEYMDTVLSSVMQPMNGLRNAILLMRDETQLGNFNKWPADKRGPIEDAQMN